MEGLLVIPMPEALRAAGKKYIHAAKSAYLVVRFDTTIENLKI
jgi:hypothetical protein